MRCAAGCALYGKVMLPVAASQAWRRRSSHGVKLKLFDMHRHAHYGINNGDAAVKFGITVRNGIHAPKCHYRGFDTEALAYVKRLGVACMRCIGRSLNWHAAITSTQVRPRLHARALTSGQAGAAPHD